MITVYLNNGQTAEIPSARAVTIDWDKDREVAFVNCKDANGKLVGQF